MNKYINVNLTATEGDFVGERHRDIGIGAYGIDALNHVLNNGLNLRVSGQHFYLLCVYSCLYIIFFKYLCMQYAMILIG